MVSSKKVFNSCRRKYALEIFYVKKNAPQFASKGSPQRAVTGKPLWASVRRRNTRKWKTSSDLELSVKLKVITLVC